MTKKRAREMLWQTHTIWYIKYAKQLLKALKLPENILPITTLTDTRSEFKGITLYGKKEGEEAQGVDSKDLTYAITKHLNLKCERFLGRGSQQKEYADKITKALKL